METIVALGVILAATAGPVALITRGITDFSFSKNKLIAANLAQEGVELVRAVRENNVICDALNGATVWPWNEDPEPPNPPGSGNPFSSITAGVAVDQTTTVTCGIPGVAISVPILSSSCATPLRFDPATGIYGYAGPQETQFKRCVSIKVSPDSPDSAVPSGDQMDITSRVEWQERRISRELILRERLYNWR